MNIQKATLHTMCWCNLLAFASIAAGQTKPATQTAPYAATATITTQVALPVPATQPAAAGDQGLRSADLAKALSSTSVTLNLEKAAPLAAIAELAKQSGYEVRPYSDSWWRQGRYQNVTISMTNQPFWVALREICVKAGINLYNSGGEQSRAIQLIPGNSGGQGMMKAPCSIKGPFLVVVSNLERVNHVNMSQPSDVNRDIRIQIQTFIEPKINITQMQYEPRIDEAVDDNGNSMTPPRTRNDNMQGERGISFYGSFTLPYPKTNPGHKVARVKGHIDTKVQLSSDPWEIADPLNAAEVTKTIAGRKFTFLSLKKENDRQYILKVVMYRGDMDQQEFYNQMNETIPLHLTDAQGREYGYYNGGGNSDADKMTRIIRFNSRSGGSGSAPGEPVKLIAEIPTGVQEFPIPFELLDLPMP